LVSVNITVLPISAFNAREADEAADAVPNKEPVKLVDVTLVRPASVVDVPPNDIPVDPIVTLLFVSCELPIPERVPPKVKLPVLVTVPDKEIPLTVPVPPTDVTPLLTTLVAQDAVPFTVPFNEPTIVPPPPEMDIVLVSGL
jgi:hypothetical protein